MMLRLALQTMSQVMWSWDRFDFYSWCDSSVWSDSFLDPVVTVHPDRLFFEAFSQDAGAYAAVQVERDFFETDREVVCGTTNVDFTNWLHQSLGELRSSRQTWLTIEAAGIGITTGGHGTHFERKVELPEEWVRGLLRVQEAMTIPGTRVAVRAIDLLKAIRFIRIAKARLSPRALRWEFEPDQPPCMVLEPWEEKIVCASSTHSYAERRVVRTWGRSRLSLLEPLLPYADAVDVYLKGRALPSFYMVHLPGIRFLLGLSGWTRQSWSDDAAFELLTRRDGRDLTLIEPTLAYLREAKIASVDELACAVECDWETSRRLLVRLARQGQVMHDLERRRYRHRELFVGPIDEEKLFPPDVRRTRGLEYVSRRQVQVTDSAPRETRKLKVLPTPEGKITREVVFRDWVVTGLVGGQATVEIVLNDEGKVIFGKCGCDFFRTNILNQGPCEHMVALLEASAESRKVPDVHNEVPGADPGR
jgi:hypothetical protein